MKRQTEKRQEKIYLRFFLFSLEATGIKLAHFALEISPQQEINPLFLFLLIFFYYYFFIGSRWCRFASLKTCQVSSLSLYPQVSCICGGSCGGKEKYKSLRWDPCVIISIVPTDFTGKRLCVVFHFSLKTKSPLLIFPLLSISKLFSSFFQTSSCFLSL